MRLRHHRHEGRIRHVWKTWTGSELAEAPVVGDLFPSDNLFPSDLLFPGGATQIVVVDPWQFDLESGRLTIGTETVGYSVPDPEADLPVFDLDTPLVGTYDVGEPVYFATPLGVTRYAEVQETGQEEAYPAVVHHSLYDKLALGPRAEGAEQLAVVERQGEELVVVDLKGKAPNVDGQFVDTETLPGDALVTSTQEELGLSSAGVVRSGFAQVTTSENTTSTTPADLATVGPQVTIDVPANAMVALFVQAEIKPNGASGLGQVYITEATDFPTGVRVLQGDVVGSFIAKALVPGSAEGLNANSASSWMLYPATAGTRTYKLQYSKAVGTSADFRNRRLWARALVVGA